MNTLLLTVVAMMAFAANSLLCRLALGQGLIDAASFTSVRMVSGAVVLALMAVAGIAWGFYSLLGRGVKDPVEATANNFIYSVPLVVAVSLIFMSEFHGSVGGFALAVASGALASGLGYVVWYAALPGLTATRAATVQLSVPVIATFGGVILLSEELTLRLLLASVATLGGVAIVLSQRARAPGS